MATRNPNAERKKAEVYLEYQPYVDAPPRHPRSMWQQATSNDQTTVDHWREIWIANALENHKQLGPFKERSIGKLHGLYRNLPIVAAGSGPSLTDNGLELKDRAGVPLISCLHNFHYFEDNDIHVDFYVTLDAGKVTIEEVREGGQNSEEWYWERTKDRKLLAYIGSPPELLAKWRGEIYFFNAPVPDTKVIEEIEKVERFNIHVGSGGNVLGACTYIAKAILGCNPIIFVGANFSFGYHEKFHGWDSKYDKDLGNWMKVTDIYGNKVKTWPSYWNFKNYFDWLVTTIPGLYLNCTEGGCFGAYPEGNIRDLIQMDLTNALKMYRLVEATRESCENPEVEKRMMLY